MFIHNRLTQHVSGTIMPIVRRTDCIKPRVVLVWMCWLWLCGVGTRAERSSARVPTPHNKHLYLCHLLVLSSPTWMMHGHTNLKLDKGFSRLDNSPKKRSVTLPTVRCEDERNCSKFSIMRDKIRSTMLEESLHYLSILPIESDVIRWRYKVTLQSDVIKWRYKVTLQSVVTKWRYKVTL